MATTTECRSLPALHKRYVFFFTGLNVSSSFIVAQSLSWKLSFTTCEACWTSDYLGMKFELVLLGGFFCLFLNDTPPPPPVHLPKDKTIKLWKISERDKRAEGYNLKDEDGRLRDPFRITTLRASSISFVFGYLFPDSVWKRRETSVSEDNRQCKPLLLKCKLDPDLSFFFLYINHR